MLYKIRAETTIEKTTEYIESTSIEEAMNVFMELTGYKMEHITSIKLLSSNILRVGTYNLAYPNEK